MDLLDNRFSTYELGSKKDLLPREMDLSYVLSCGLSATENYTPPLHRVFLGLHYILDIGVKHLTKYAAQNVSTSISAITSTQLSINTVVVSYMSPLLAQQ